ncbi:hypothetical protein BGZ95_000129, partial [Linnemannia exigua]
DKTARFWEMSPTGVDPAAEDTFNVKTIAAYSPDGRFLISEGHSGILQHYDADTGEIGLTLRSRDDFKCVAYSPNGLQIATASLKNEVKLWNTQSCAVEGIIQTKDAVSIVAYSPCGRWIAMRMAIEGVEVWDARSESSWHLCLGRPAVISLAFSPHGLDLAVGFDNGDIRVWETSTWSCKMVINGDSERGACVVYPPKSSHLAYHHKCGATEISLYDEKGQTCRTILGRYWLEVERFAYSFCGLWILAVDRQVVHLWKSTSDGMESDWALATTVETFFGNVREIAWRPNTTEFATASEDGSIRAWKVEEESGKVSVRLLWGHGGTVLTASKAVFVGSVGLSTTNQDLLRQRGANFWSSSSYSDGS